MGQGTERKKLCCPHHFQDPATVQSWMKAGDGRGREWLNKARGSTEKQRIVERTKSVTEAAPVPLRVASRALPSRLSPCQPIMLAQAVTGSGDGARDIYCADRNVRDFPHSF
jgi:hypothetical protein